jgi:hypothetical protein
MNKDEALDKMAENARELGLDYEPVDGTQVSKVWWDGEKLMAKPIPLEDFYLPAPKVVDCHATGVCVQSGLRAEMPAPVQEPWEPRDTAHRPGGLPQDFTTHEVESFDDWSEWVNPKAEQYFMKCCDCGLVHEMQFKVAKYSKGDECEFVADANLQAVFRARRTTPPAERQWTGLTDDEIEKLRESFATRYAIEAIEAKLKEKNTAAQPAAQESVGTYGEIHESMQALAAPVQGAVSRDAIVIALTSCPHVIDRESVILERDQKQGIGVALAQAVDRLAALFTTPPAQPVIPDAMTSADIQEHIEYVAGWNDCRQAMMEMMK